MKHIVMLLSNPFRPDPRVLKEATSLSKAGFRISILCWDRASEYPAQEKLDSDIQIIRIQGVASNYGIGTRQMLRILRFWIACIPILKRLQPHAIHCHDFDTLPLGLYWGLYHKIPVIYDAHEYYADLCKPRLKGVVGLIIYRLIRILEHLGARLSSAVIVVDDTMNALFSRDNKRVITIGHYPSFILSNKSLAFTRDALTLIYIGRLSKDRGLLIYLDILRLLKERGVPAKLKLAGSFIPADEENLFRQNIHALETCVDLMGWVRYENIPFLLQSADLGLVILTPIPRYINALPVKLFEYMAAGLPVIACDYPAIRGIIQEAQCGALVNYQSATQEAVEIICNWWNNRSTPRKLGENGRLAVVNQYGWNTLAFNLVNLYREILL